MKSWWSIVKQLTDQGKHANNSASKQLLDGELLTPADFCTRLNAYYAQVGRAAIPVTEQLRGKDYETNSTACLLEQVSLRDIKQ